MIMIVTEMMMITITITIVIIPKLRDATNMSMLKE